MYVLLDSSYVCLLRRHSWALHIIHERDSNLSSLGCVYNFPFRLKPLFISLCNRQVCKSLGYHSGFAYNGSYFGKPPVDKFLLENVHCDTQNIALEKFNLWQCGYNNFSQGLPECDPSQAAGVYCIPVYKHSGFIYGYNYAWLSSSSSKDKGTENSMTNKGCCSLFILMVSWLLGVMTWMLHGWLCNIPRIANSNGSNHIFLRLYVLWPIS